VESHSPPPRGSRAGTVPLPVAIGIGEPSIASAANDMTPWVLPSMPTKCTEAQKSSGNVAGCLFDGTAGLPEDRGWPTPPFPETPTTTTTALGPSGQWPALSAPGLLCGSQTEDGRRRLGCTWPARAVAAPRTANGLWTQIRI
jgi:hypothetical protein